MSHYGDEQIVGIIRESHAHGVAATSKKFKVSSHTIYIWRKKYGSMEPSQVSELKRITQEYARLKKLDSRNIAEVHAFTFAVKRGIGQRRVAALMEVSRSMLTYQRGQPVKDAPVRTIINGVVVEHPA